MYFYIHWLEKDFINETKLSDSFYEVLIQKTNYNHAYFLVKQGCEAAPDRHLRRQSLAFGLLGSNEQLCRGLLGVGGVLIELQRLSGSSGEAILRFSA